MKTWKIDSPLNQGELKDLPLIGAGLFFGFSFNADLPGADSIISLHSLFKDTSTRKKQGTRL
ncbi:hypothetical protein [Cyclonatronum proteinivorum]|uniref:hypothetical protein n=1 Tax=Cyclonatronum proteinivorum TaxID=1457365 RepID=UPI000E0EB3FE|nr:hypothetical protein [Cyclonatronum proteinivorum]